VEGFTPVATVSNSSTAIFGYVGYSGTTVQVVFRGTVVQELQNWIDDLNFAHAIPYPLIPGAFVHSGFYNSWISVRDQVVAGIKQVYDVITPSQYYFTGHSLGAAISVLAAFEIGSIVDVPVICYNYGDPRVGDQTFAKYFNQHIDTTWRITNQRDIVPHLPPMRLGFWHIATEVWWNTTTTHKICNDSGEDPTCSDSNSVDLSIPEHLDYLNVHLTSGHPYGCK
jgi:predicted lipase